MNNFLKNNKQLFICFISYLAVLFIFSTIYFELYNQNPNHFLINNDIIKQKNQTDSINIRNEHFETNKKLIDLSTFKNKLKYLNNFFENKIKPDSIFLNIGDNLANQGAILSFTSSFRISDEVIQISISPTVGRTGLSYLNKVGRIKFLQKNGSIFEKITFVSGKETIFDSHNGNISVFKVVIQEILKEVNTDYELLINKLENIVSLERLETSFNKNTAHWDYLDFVYFTVFSLPVNNYGDIVPNSKTVRLLLSLESILIWIIMIIFINAKFNEQNTKQFTQ